MSTDDQYRLLRRDVLKRLTDIHGTLCDGGPPDRANMEARYKLRFTIAWLVKVNECDGDLLAAMEPESRTRCKTP